MADIISFKERLQTLVTKFKKDKTHYRSKGYPEAQVRIDFLNPFFKALGWDMENKAQQPPHARDVIVELSPETTGRPDYNFRINGATKFFVEAKAPSVALDDVNHILQAKTYAWSTKEVYFVVLTDFEEFRLYDASLKPNPRFPDEGLILDLKYTDYLDGIEKLWELSKERVEQGSLDALLPKDTKSKRLRIPPDKSFLEDLTIWRTELAKDIHKRNPDFDVKLLNDVVQKLLDRIIFIRIAEDRRIRPDRELWEIVAQWREEGKRKSIMSHLKDLFHEVNDDLNGDIFKPHACEAAEVDSGLLAEIIENLYFPKSRYRFDAIGVELLGSIYERYLGSTIRVTPQRIKVEEKPEVRKAGGVYYTPKYIVDYIVKNTVGKLIEGKTPRQIEKIRILDPACGSGSFLLGAYQYLIDYHLEYYRKHPKEAQTQFFDFYHKVGPEDLSLPLRTKAKILRNNIFGVDIDPQAVEITMMSLYLKALEGERGLLPKKQHLLPPLSNNIKCGNSLIGYDILDSSLFSSLRAEGEAISDDTKARINPFDWNSKSTGFGEIMNPSQSPLAKGGTQGGFDVVIGNPPYVRIQAMKEWAPVEVKFYKKHYASASKGNYDIYVVFVEKGLSLLNQKGRLGFILPHKFFQSQYGEPLRGIISTGKHLSEIVHFGHQQIFEGATTYTCLLFLDKAPCKQIDFIKVDDVPAWRTTGQGIKGNIPSSEVKETEWNFTVGEGSTLFKKLNKTTLKLGDIADIFVGLQTSADDVFIMDLIEDAPRTLRLKSKSIDAEWIFEKGLVFPLVSGTDVSRYSPLPTRQYILFPYEVEDTSATLIDFKLLSEDYPKTAAYLKENKKRLEERERGKFKDNNWYRFGRSQNIGIQGQIKLCVPRLVDKLYAAYDISGDHYLDNVDVGGMTLRTEYRHLDYKYLLALLNSRLLQWYFPFVSLPFRGGWLSANRQFLAQLPIRTIDFNNPSEEAIHDKLVSLVDRMLDLHKKKNSLLPSAEREKIEREIAITDEKIDEIVYGLYGVTKEEKKVLERR
ncbi:MAG: Eco57I restriction-modification methylase domain-containing protein [Nitrospirae bacterium]|nr:Eco57I restriction-modification methylase domain-containing protein [Nitrospirota bacterium]